MVIVSVTLNGQNCSTELYEVFCYFKFYIIVELDILYKFMLLKSFVRHFFNT